MSRCALTIYIMTLFSHTLTLQMYTIPLNQITTNENLCFLLNSLAPIPLLQHYNNSFFIIFFGILAVILYKLCGGRRSRNDYLRSDSPTDHQPPPPPYSPYSKYSYPQQPYQGWRPGFWTGLGLGGVDRDERLGGTHFAPCCNHITPNPKASCKCK